MFTDARSRKVIFVAHCVLNQNAISDGTADFPGSDAGLVRKLLDEGVGIVQLPCPELHCLGLDRGDPSGAGRPVVEENTRIREAMGRTTPSRILASLVERVVFEVEEYRRHGFALVGFVGINRSPCCGVDTTSRHGREEPGQGVFMEALRQALSDRGIPAAMIGVKASRPEEAQRRLEALLRGA